MFATDRDLLVISPRVFGACAWAAQRRVSGVGTIAGTGLTMTASDVSLESAGVDAGHIALIDEVPHEILARTGAQTATVSRVRASASDGAIPPAPGVGRAVRVVTFGPQIRAAHARLMSAAGLEPGDPRVTNGAELAALEAVWALALIWTGAHAVGDSDAPEQAEWFARELAWMRGVLRLRLDTDGDGEFDEERPLSAMRFVRD